MLVILCLNPYKVITGLNLRSNLLSVMENLCKLLDTQEWLNIYTSLYIFEDIITTYMWGCVYVTQDSDGGNIVLLTDHALNIHSS